MIKIRFLLIFVFVFNISFTQSVRINEVVASNSNLIDEDGDTPDWIELYNYGSEEISLSNWSLTDVLDDNNPWIFPDISMDAGEYLLIWASDKDRSGITYARTLINEGDSFRYEIPNEDTDINWMNTDFNDDEWSIGNSGFGYADGDDNTYIAAGTLAVYLRKSFTIEDVSEINSLVLDVDYDDGFVAYINGIEIARANINGTPPLYNTTTLTDHEAQIYNGGNPDRFLINNFQDYLINGENIFSIQVHNISNNSSDMTIIPFLSAIYDNETSVGIEPPAILGLQSESFLHTDFKLSSSGETVFLNDENGDLIDSISFGALPSNISYGVSIENGVYVAYQEPTPGEQNNTFEYSGVLGVPLTFSHNGGNITSSINLEIFGDGTEDMITYTTDFTEPDEN
ncbi:lamin tail domain-containing protein, partial [archaeon]|nr:lamin tail domain-containing protein [archaeon]NDB80533.1 lamin tail domain-containing protein [archaeon]